MTMPRPPIREVPKAWGREVWIANNDRYCGKILYVDAGASGSLHYHPLKHETFYLRAGRMTIEVGNYGIVRELVPGEAVDVPAGVLHRFTAVEASEIWEFSTPHDDADVVRLVPSHG